MSEESMLGLAPLTDADVLDLVRLDIQRRPVDSYTVGGFRYSNLKDAVAQAERQRLNERA